MWQRRLIVPHCQPQLCCPARPRFSRAPVMEHAPISLAVPQAERLRSNIAYFDALFALVPADAYFGPTEDEKEASASSRFTRNKRGVAPEHARKLATKAAARLARFDPELAAATLVPGAAAARAAADAACDDAVLEDAALSGSFAGSRVKGGLKRERADDDGGGGEGDDDDDDEEEEEDDDDDGDGDGDDDDGDAGDGDGGSDNEDDGALGAGRADSAGLMELRERLTLRLAALKAARTTTKDWRGPSAAEQKRSREKEKKRAAKKARKDASRGIAPAPAAAPAAKGAAAKSATAPPARAPSTAVPSKASAKPTPAQTPDSAGVRAPLTGVAALAAQAAARARARAAAEAVGAATSTSISNVGNSSVTRDSGAATTVAVAQAKTTAVVPAKAAAAAAALAVRPAKKGPIEDAAGWDIAFGALASSLPGPLATAALLKAPDAPAPGGKTGALKAMLKKAKAFQNELATLNSAGDTSGAASLQFSAALARAGGAPVRDDPALVQKALARKKANKARSAAEWAERAANEGATKSARDSAKAENRDKKTQRAIKKKDRRAPPKAAAAAPAAAASPAQKLARPGFEGRRGGGGK